MGTYKVLSFIQSLIILFLGTSVLDFGLDALGTGSGIGLNDLIDDNIGLFEIWGYLIIAVGIFQILKTLTIGQEISNN
jgi:hypothetical protein